MPSLSNNINDRSLVELTTTDFNNEVTKDKASNIGNIDFTIGINSASNKKAIEQGFSSAIANTGPGVGKDLGEAALGIFRTQTEVLCPASRNNKSTRNGKNNRKLGSGNIPSGCVPNKDDLLNIDDSVDSAIKNNINSIPDNLLADYEDGLKSSSKRTASIFAGTGVEVSEKDIVDEGIKELSNSIGPVGATIADKIDIRTMLGCPGDSSKNSSKLDKSAIKTTLKNTRCADIDKVVGILGTLISKIEVFPSDDILDIYSDSIVSGEEGSVHGVVGLGKVAAANGGVRLDTKDPKIANKLLDKVSEVNVADDSADVDGVIGTLSVVSPGWNTDKDGNPDHSAVSGNKFINKGVSNKVKSNNTYQGRVSITPPPSTPEENESYMMLLASSW